MQPCVSLVDMNPSVYSLSCWHIVPIVELGCCCIRGVHGKTAWGYDYTKAIIGRESCFQAFESLRGCAGSNE